MKVKFPPSHVGHECRFRFDVPLCLEEALFDLNRFILVLRDFPTSSSSTIMSMPFSCTNASSRTTSAAVRLSPLSCLKSHPPCRLFCNDEVACQSRRSRFHCRYVYAGVGDVKPEVDSAQTVVTLLYRHQLFPIALPWFRPTPGSATNCRSFVSGSFSKLSVS